MQIKPNRFPHIPKMPGVYLITSKITGLMYVGSSQNLNRRIAFYHTPGADTRKWMSDFDVSDFTFKVLETVEKISENELFALELYWIKTLNTVFPNGMNKRCPVTNKSLCGVKGKSNKRVKGFYINVLRDY